MHNFIKARLNKDNLFNVLFFLGMSGGYNLVLFLKIQPASSIINRIGNYFCHGIYGQTQCIHYFDKEKMEFIRSNGSRSKNSGVGLFLTPTVDK